MSRPLKIPTFSEVEAYSKKWNIPRWTQHMGRIVPPIDVYKTKYAKLNELKFRWEIQRRTPDYRQFYDEWKNGVHHHIKDMLCPCIEAEDIPSNAHYLQLDNLAGTDLSAFINSTHHQFNINHLIFSSPKNDDKNCSIENQANFDHRKVGYEWDCFVESKKQELLDSGMSFITLIVDPKVGIDIHREKAWMAIDKALKIAKNPDGDEIASLSKIIQMGLNLNTLSRKEAEVLSQKFNQELHPSIKAITAHTRLNRHLLMMVLDGYGMGVSPTIIGSYLPQNSSKKIKLDDTGTASKAARWRKDAIAYKY